MGFTVLHAGPADLGMFTLSLRSLRPRRLSGSRLTDDEAATSAFHHMVAPIDIL